MNKAASVGRLFHFMASVQYRLLALFGHYSGNASEKLL